jgi:hypothetical protein
VSVRAIRDLGLLLWQPFWRMWLWSVNNLPTLAEIRCASKLVYVWGYVRSSNYTELFAQHYPKEYADHQKRLARVWAMQHPECLRRPFLRVNPVIDKNVWLICDSCHFALPPFGNGTAALTLEQLHGHAVVEGWTGVLPDMKCRRCSHQFLRIAPMLFPQVVLYWLHWGDWYAVTIHSANGTSPQPAGTPEKSANNKGRKEVRGG